MFNIVRHPVISASALIAATLVLEGVAVWILRRPLAGAAGVVDFFALQALAGLPQACLLHRLLPKSGERTQRHALVAVWVSCVMLPVLGMLAIGLNLFLVRRFPLRDQPAAVCLVPPPRFDGYRHEQDIDTANARLRARLLNHGIPLSERLAALLAIQNMPTRTTGVLLRTLLTDPAEDIRLVAYGKLDQVENDLMQKIFEASEALEAVEQNQPLDQERCHSLHRLLAELHFEVIYQNLAQGAVFERTVQQASQHAQRALEFDDSDGALWWICGRLALAKRNADAAENFMERARTAGFPANRLPAWLAEAAFLKGDWERVKELIGELGRTREVAALRTTADYWS